MSKSNSKLFLFFVLISLVLTACQDTYSVGDYYNVDGDKGVVIAVDEAGVATQILSLNEASNLNVDSALVWAAALGEGWKLIGNDQLETLSKNKIVVNETLKRKKAPSVLDMNTWYWSSVPCGDNDESASHYFAFGPDGLRCYFRENASPLYRARAIKVLTPSN